MIKLKKPLNLNGTELRIEFANAGIELLGSFDGEADLYVINDDLFINVPENLKDAAASVVAAHNGTVIAPEPTMQQKLANVGLDLNDLKSALGL